MIKSFCLGSKSFNRNPPPPAVQQSADTIHSSALLHNILHRLMEMEMEEGDTEGMVTKHMERAVMAASSSSSSSSTSSTTRTTPTTSSSFHSDVAAIHDEDTVVVHIPSLPILQCVEVPVFSKSKDPQKILKLLGGGEVTNTLSTTLALSLDFTFP